MTEQADGLGTGLAIVVMGVSGAGKSTVGSMLANTILCPFIDADDFHSVKNKEKMSNGIQLTDADRLPWLRLLRDELQKYVNKGQCVVLACSALRCHYREILLSAAHRSSQGDNFTLQSEMKKDDHSSQQQGEHLTLQSELKSDNLNSKRGRVMFVYLKGSMELFTSRLAARYREGAHFMPPSLLKSQMDLLELRDDDERVISVDASLSPEDIVCLLKTKLSQLPGIAREFPPTGASLKSCCL